VLVPLLAAAALAIVGAPPDDVRPLWSPDARYLLFEHDQVGQPAASRVVSVGRGSFVFRGTGAPRGWTADDGFGIADGAATRIHSLAGAEVATFGGSDAAWSADGTRVAFSAAGGIWVGDVTGGHALRLASAPTQDVPWDVSGLVWSRDGTELAWSERTSDSARSSIRVLDVGSGAVRTVFTGANANVNPSFSPDGEQLAFETNAGPRWRVLLVGVDGSNPHPLETGNWNDRLPQWSPVAPQLLVLSDRSGIPSPAGPTAYDLWLVAADRSSPDRRLAYDVNPLFPGRWSPTAAQVAYSAGRECLRWGVYVENVTTRQERRLSNICHFNGTPQRNDLNGTPYRDFLRGLGDSDTIHGRPGNDKLEGNNGDDRLYGGNGADAIFGGPGNDRIYGDSGNDMIVGGPGHDFVDCGTGFDTVVATRLDTVRNCEKVGT
jgi:Tol biopolymer transport system component